MSDPISGHPFRTLVEMARAAQHDDRQSTGALYGKLADRIETLEKALRFLLDTKWKSVDKDNMEFEGHVTCYQLDKARAALAPEQEK